MKTARPSLRLAPCWACSEQGRGPIRASYKKTHRRLWPKIHKIDGASRHVDSCSLSLPINFNGFFVDKSPSREATMRILIGANQHEYYTIQAELQKIGGRLSNATLHMEDNRYGVIQRVSDSYYDLVAVDYDLGGLLFIQEIISKNSGIKQLCIYGPDACGHGSSSAIESACRNMKPALCQTTSEFLKEMRIYFRKAG